MAPHERLSAVVGPWSRSFAITNNFGCVFSEVEHNNFESHNVNEYLVSLWSNVCTVHRLDSKRMEWHGTLARSVALNVKSAEQRIWKLYRQLQTPVQHIGFPLLMAAQYENNFKSFSGRTNSRAQCASSSCIALQCDCVSERHPLAAGLSIYRTTKSWIAWNGRALLPADCEWVCVLTLFRYNSAKVCSEIISIGKFVARERERVVALFIYV